MTQQQWVGIDISQKQLDIALHPSGINFSVKHTQAGRTQLIEKLREHSIAGIVLEATGGLEVSIMEALESSGYETRRVNPLQVRHFAKALGKQAKTDRIDAAVIAHFGDSTQPRVTRLPNCITRELQALVIRRQQVVELITREKNRLHSCQDWVKKSIETVIDALETELEVLEARMATLSEQRSDWQERLEILTSVKGIGTVISQALLVQLPELGERSGKTIAALVGVAPFNHDSGRFRGKRRIRGGRKTLRSLLYMGTMSAVQHNRVIRAHYEQLRARGKEKKVAMVACMRKLLVILNAMLRDGKAWCEPELADSTAAL